MDIILLENNLESAEGDSTTIYLDDKGNPTGGKGHLILPTDINPATGVVYKVGDFVPAYQIEAWFVADVDTAKNQTENILQTKFGMNLYSLPNYCQEALIELCFNVGAVEFADFVNTIGLIKAGNYSGAAVHLGQNLEWVKDVGPVRSKRSQDMIAGTWTPPSQPVEVAENP